MPICFWVLEELIAMDADKEPTLHPEQCVKLIHLVRHAQGIHNVEGDKNREAYLSPELFDAHLTPLGWSQVDNLQKQVHAGGLAKRVELVVVSPLLRTLQTAAGVFGGAYGADIDYTLPLMVANAGNSNRFAISSVNCPPFMAIETCREHLGVFPCDKRRSVTEYQQLFPAINFSLIESNEDVLWQPKVRETKEDMANRGLDFLNWLWMRKEKEIAVVTHGDFLYHTLYKFWNDSDPSIKADMRKRFNNCELRSLMLSNRSMVSSDLAVTAYPRNLVLGFHSLNDKIIGKQPDEENFIA